MLKSLKTKNFKKLNDHQFDFTSGLNIICGENTAGKTTLTQAIGFALFGVKAVPGRSEKIPTWGSKDCQVILEADQYIIDRTLKNCTVSKNGDIKAVGNTACSQFIQDNITGMVYKDFKTFNWSGPSETAALLTIGATQLQRDIEKFSGVEFIDNIIKAANKDNNVIKQDLAGAELIDVIPYQKKADSLTIDKDHQTDGIANVGDQLFEVEKDLDVKSGELEEAKQTNLRRTELISMVAQNRADVEATAPELESTRAELSKLSAVSWEHGEELSELQASRKTAESINTLLTAKGTDLDVAKGRLVRIRAEMIRDVDRQKVIDDLTAEVQAAQGVYDGCNTIVNNSLDRKSVLEESIEAGVCSECNRPYEGADSEGAEKELTKLLEDIKQQETDNSETSIHLNTAKKKLSSTEKVTGARDQANQEELRVNDLIDWINEHQFTDVDELTARIDDLLKEKATVEAVAETIDTLTKKVDRLTTKLAGARQCLIVSEDGLAGLPTVEDIDKLDDEVKDLIRMQSREQLALRDMQEKMKTIDRELTAANTYIKESTTYNAEVKKLTEESANLSSFISFLRESRVTFLSSIWQQILGYASSFVYQASGGIVDEITNVDGFEFSEDGVFAPVESASGAQRGFIGVAVRIALSQSLGIGMDSIILDEPTEAMREENAARLAGSLLSQKQVLMITHRESDQVAGASIIEIG